MAFFAFLFLAILTQGCGLAAPLAATVAEKGFEYRRDGTVIAVMACPLELCVEYGRTVFREMSIECQVDKEEFSWTLHGAIPRKEIDISFYPLDGKLTRATGHVYWTSAKIVYEREIAEEILAQIKQALNK